MSRTRIKMCGTTNLLDAETAIKVGVDGLGFIFVDKSPRNIQPKVAKKIISALPPLVSLVGVFVDRPMVEVEEIVKYTGLSHVQLHGKEDPEYCKKLLIKIPSCKIIKAFRVGEESKKENFTLYNQSVIGFLLDTYVKNMEGGTGRPFDWSIIQSLDLKRPLILAGGLTPENVSYAIEKVNPYAIDINSGVEIEPGLKDHTQLQLLSERVRSADQKNRMNVSER